MRTLLAAAAFLPLAAWASEAGYPIERAPIDPRDLVSLQAGARTFVNYCLGCHGAQHMRYNRLADLGLNESQIRDSLMFTATKVGEPMKTALSPKDGKDWFGVPPPDLTVIARSRGADWLYSYLRAFYRDPRSATGWNNAVFENVAMPHALWALQGELAMEKVEAKDLAGHEHTEYQWTQLSKGSQSTLQYDATVRDLVNFLVYLGEPAGQTRKRLGVAVLFVLALVYVAAYALKRE